jgi:hypothetical protein
MRENAMMRFSENETVSLTDAKYTVNVTVGSDPCQLLYDCVPAGKAKVGIDGVPVTMAFNLQTPGYEFTKVAPSTHLLINETPLLPATSVTIISILPHGQSGHVIFTVTPLNGTYPTPPPAGPEVINDGSDGD